MRVCAQLSSHEDLNATRMLRFGKGDGLPTPENAAPLDHHDGWLIDADILYSDAQSRGVRPTPNLMGTGVVFSTPLGRMTARAYLGVSPQPIPTKIFKTDRAARQWVPTLRTSDVPPGPASP